MCISTHKTVLGKLNFSSLKASLIKPCLNKNENLYKLFFIIIFIFFSLINSAQKKVSGIITEKIDSLQKVLILLKDTLRIDCLNEISHEYILTEKKDSALYFSNLAYNEAKNINYLHGIAMSYFRKAHIAKHFDDDFIQSEELGKASLSWYKRTGNKKGIDILYGYLWYTVFAQSRFEEAIEYAKKQYSFAKQSGDQSEIENAFDAMYATYRQSGNYEQSFLYAQRRYDLALQTKNKFRISRALYSMAQLYELIEDYSTALIYFRKVIQLEDDEIRKRRVETDNDIWFKMEFTEAFSNLHQFDSAWHYYNLFKPGIKKAVYMRVWWVSTGECYFLQKNYNSALLNFQLGLAEHRKLNDRNEVMRTLLDIGKTYLALNNNLEALKYGREGLSISLQTQSKQYIREGYRILSIVYDRLYQTDSANHYFRQYVTAREAALNDQVKAKFSAYSWEQKIALVNKERQIGGQQLKIQQQQLQKEAFYKKMLVAAIVTLFLLGVFIVRNIILKRRNEKQLLEHALEMQKLDSEKTKAQFQQQTTELEMQALRAQMNPHFIFNSLNSINRFILQNNKAEASEYLTKFSKLVRLILQNSQASLITLESELEALELYLQLEALRFNNRFNYKISVSKNIDIETIKVPPLIIQPYAENAIWHGLMHKHAGADGKEEKGQLDIEVSQEEDYLFFKITDDGIGRKKAEELNSKSATKHKSVGLKITADRIAMMQQTKGSESPVSINDLVNADGSAAGTEVIIKIPVINN